MRKAAPWIAVEVPRSFCATRWSAHPRGGGDALVAEASLGERALGVVAAQPGHASGRAQPREDHNVSIEPHPGGGYVVRLPAEGVQIERRNDRLYRVTTEPVVGESHHDDIDTWLDELRALGAGHTEDLLQMGRGIVGSIVGGVFSFFYHAFDAVGVSRSCGHP